MARNEEKPKVKLKPISDKQMSCLECKWGTQLLGGQSAYCLHTGKYISELVGCELWTKQK